MAPVAGPALCIPILDCSIDQCSGHGTCYMTGGTWACRCEKGWEGDRCNRLGAAIASSSSSASLGAGPIVGIILALLLLLCKSIYGKPSKCDTKLSNCNSSHFSQLTVCFIQMLKLLIPMNFHTVFHTFMFSTDMITHKPSINAYMYAQSSFPVLTIARKEHC